MTHRLAGILSDYLSREQMIEKDEADIYQYGLEIFMDGVLETLLLVVLGILWGRFWQSICFIVSFTVLRSFTGGYHAATKVRCAGATVGLYILNLTAAGELDSHFTALLLLAAVGTGIIWWLAPVPHANKPLDGEQVVINRKKSRRRNCSRISPQRRCRPIRRCASLPRLCLRRKSSQLIFPRIPKSFPRISLPCFRLQIRFPPSIGRQA